jgi:hypothetical protein
MGFNSAFKGLVFSEYLYDSMAKIGLTFQKYFRILGLGRTSKKNSLAHVLG